jgi:tRNA A64-2'-O-ribosylphosphate transferase
MGGLVTRKSSPRIPLTRQSSSLTLPRLDKPLRLFFIHPSTSTLPSIPTDPPFYPIICLSASRWIGSRSDDIPTFTRIDRQTVGFEYVPGAGDDDELWARGLTPRLFHGHRERLLKTPRDELVSAVDELVMQSLVVSTARVDLGERETSVDGSHRKLVGYPKSDSRLALDLGVPLSGPVWAAPEETKTVSIVQVDKPLKELGTIAPLDSSGTQHLVLLPNPRGDGKTYLGAFSAALEFIHVMLSTHAVVVTLGNQQHIDAASSHAANAAGTSRVDSPPFQSTWQNGPEDFVSSRKVILPLVVALACQLESREAGLSINKDTIARQVQRLVTLWPDSNPPRAALKRLNEVLMSDPRR